ncbi:hypothetical protein L1887_28836 [Cichorium endivia]|nr:hypothetical protein L1887_28836 [Cichorium endivia]
MNTHVVEYGEVIALRDIAKCLYDAIPRMERAAEKGKAITAAVEGVDDLMHLVVVFRILPSLTIKIYTIWICSNKATFLISFIVCLKIK